MAAVFYYCTHWHRLDILLATNIESKLIFALLHKCIKRLLFAVIIQNVWFTVVSFFFSISVINKSLYDVTQTLTTCGLLQQRGVVKTSRRELLGILLTSFDLIVIKTEIHVNNNNSSNNNNNDDYDGMNDDNNNNDDDDDDDKNSCA